MFFWGVGGSVFSMDCRVSIVAISPLALPPPQYTCSEVAA